jgi:DNA helicase-2/ATP-dependent DNA helicase PcrA
MVNTDFLKDLNEEKQNIIKTDGNVLVTANPGTGKTKLLAYKYAYLVTNGIKPEDILCLTFTEKAKVELDERIVKLLRDINSDVDYSKVNVYTFHSYALTYLDDQDIVSSNLLRYSIYQFLKDNEVLNYVDSYLLSDIVPRTESLIRYLKSFGITADKIDLKKVKALLKEDEKGKYTKEEIDKFAEYFLKIYEHYEVIKNKIGIDYSDMLNNFMKIKNVSKFEYVLVDELQDVNLMEAEIALRAAKNFVAVGDKKQAIFGFQGGSIINFLKFKDSKKFVLGENFRSSNEVLDYAKNFFSNRTMDVDHKTDLAPLKNANNYQSEKPTVFNVPKENIFASASELAKELSKNGKKTAIITRTNGQIMKVSKELQERGIEHSTTYFSASDDAKQNIIIFLKGIFSNDIQVVKNSLFVPFSPISLQKAFELSNDYKMTLDELLDKCPELTRLRESVKNLEDINILFEKVILPVSVSYGKEYFLASLNVQESYKEAIKNVQDKSFKNFVDYLQASGLMSSESDSDKNIIVTTVHKSKGLEYENVIYLPSKPRDSSSFQDVVVEAVLKASGIHAEEELLEESLRIDFVAFTRAVSKLYILTDKAEDYLTEDSQEGKINTESIESFSFVEKHKRAYNLFVQRDYEEAKKLLEGKKDWLIKLVKNHFDSLNRISYSYATDDAYDYLTNSILKIKDFSEATDLGTRVHDIAEKMAKGEKYEEEEDTKLFVSNIKSVLEEVNKDYPKLFGAEEEILIPLSKLVGNNDKMMFKAKIDAIFTDGDKYLIVDWKTDKDDSRASKHRQQLEAYKRAFSTKHNVPLDKISVAIAFIGLRGKINLGKINYEFDDAVPRKTAFETFSKKLNVFLGWKADVDSFFNNLIEVEFLEDPLWRAVIEQYKEEKK